MPNIRRYQIYCRSGSVFTSKPLTEAINQVIPNLARLNFHYEVDYNHPQLHPSNVIKSFLSNILTLIQITTKMASVAVVKQ